MSVGLAFWLHWPNVLKAVRAFVDGCCADTPAQERGSLAQAVSATRGLYGIHIHGKGHPPRAVEPGLPISNAHVFDPHMGPRAR